jgi:hypothetical protein
MDEDLQQLMLRFLEIEKQAVRDELDDYCAALLVVITPTGRYVEHVEFSDENEKIAAYSAAIERAKASAATMIITVNAARTMKGSEVPDLEGYYWGKLAAEGARDCISITASGSGMKSIGLTLGYSIVDGSVQFDDSVEFEDTELGMLPGWPMESPSLIS